MIRILLPVLLACLLLFAGCRPQAESTVGARQPTGAANGLSAAGEPIAPAAAAARSVEAQLINRQDFFGAIEASGVVRGIQEAAIVSETSGTIQEVRVSLGEAVARGQVLVTLDDSLERYAVDQAADQLTVAEIEFAATEKLYQNGNSSAAALARAKANVSGSRSILAQARRRLSDRIISAPIRGNIAVIPFSISTGNYIQPGTVIATVVNMNRIRVEIGLGEREVQMVSVGDPARVYVDACGIEPQSAAVRAIAAGSAANQSGSFMTHVEFPNRCGGRLKSGMAARIEIASTADAPSIVIPARALIRDGEAHSVFVARPDGASYFAELRPITVGRILGDRVEVDSGLTEREILIVAPIQAIEEGTEVNPTTIRG